MLTKTQEVLDSKRASLKYVDDGNGAHGYANVYLSRPSGISFQDLGYIQMDVYVESRSGDSDKTVSVKLQEEKGGDSWQGQKVITNTYASEGVWYTMTFDFATFGTNPGEFGQRIVIQMDGENNNDPVTAYFANIRLAKSPTVAGCVYEQATNYDPSANYQLVSEYGDIACSFENCSVVPQEFLGACIKTDGVYTAVNMKNTQAGPCVNSYGGREYCRGVEPPSPPPAPPTPPAPPPLMDIPFGDWKASFLGVGGSEGSFNWWFVHPFKGEDGPARACYFDDVYRFGENGTFTNVMGNETWLDTWQNVTTAGCGPPISPHNGQNPATFQYDASTQALTIVGEGAFLGDAKVHNTGDDGQPIDNTITYKVNKLEATYMILHIEAKPNVWWRFAFNRA